MQNSFDFTAGQRQPLIVTYGIGVDSTAQLIEMYNRGIRPDAITSALMREEKRETYAYIPIMQEWLKKVGFPEISFVQYQPKDFKNWPPYHSLGQNCLTNGTLPSLAFGYKSCSLKWKVAPQNAWAKQWQPAKDWWGQGGKVMKTIGYDNSPKDLKRYGQANNENDPLFEYWYPLIEWGADRDDCKDIIRAAGQPVPPKSACVFCPSTKPDELREFHKDYLRMIVIMEARAMPRLTHIGGLWRNGCKGTRGAEYRPASMTEFILTEGLLPAEEILRLQEETPKNIILNQELHAQGFEIPEWHDFLEVYTPEDAIQEIGGCAGCTMF